MRERTRLLRHFDEAVADGVVLGQVKTAEKSNEITAIPELLKLLNLKGCLVTTDAMSCQKKTATQVLQKDADYLLSMKENQPALADAFEAAFPIAKVGGLNDQVQHVTHQVPCCHELLLSPPYC